MQDFNSYIIMFGKLFGALSKILFIIRTRMHNFFFQNAGAYGRLKNVFPKYSFLFEFVDETPNLSISLSNFHITKKIFLHITPIFANEKAT